MEIPFGDKGFGMDEMRRLLELIDEVDKACFLEMLPLLPIARKEHCSDIKIVSLDENEIHLTNRIGFRDDVDISGDWASADMLYECRIPVRILLDENLSVDQRLHDVHCAPRWKMIGQGRTKQTVVVSEDEDGQQTITTTVRTSHRANEVSRSKWHKELQDMKRISADGEQGPLA